MVVPASVPATPQPVSARPAMKAGDVGALAHSTAPMTKIDRATMNRVFMEYNEYNCPQISDVANCASTLSSVTGSQQTAQCSCTCGTYFATVYQPRSWRALN